MQRCTRRPIRVLHSFQLRCCSSPSRTIFGWARKFEAKPQPSKPTSSAKKGPILDQDNLFHPLSSSPFPDLRARAQSIKQSSRCPVCTSHAHTFSEGRRPDPLQEPKPVAFDCPDCGHPTHCSQEHWREDTEHRKYCSKLREVNEDDHDLRSGRRMLEYELPG
jgi:splicing suppressor protein 51